MPIVPLRFPCPTHWLVNICPGYDHCFLTSRRVSNYTEEGTPIFWSTGSNETNQRGHSGIDESDTMTRVDWCLRPTTAGKEHSFALSSDRTLLDYTGKYFGLQPAAAGTALLSLPIERCCITPESTLGYKIRAMRSIKSRVPKRFVASSRGNYLLWPQRTVKPVEAFARCGNSRTTSRNRCYWTLVVWETPRIFESWTCGPSMVSFFWRCLLKTNTMPRRNCRH